jgi:2-iminobutanoate/2-iminopropanoate deaminase
MPRQIISEVAGKPYSRGTRSGNMVFVSGQLGLDRNDRPVPGGVGPEMRRAMEYVREILAEAGATLDDVTMVNIYLSDPAADYGEMNEVYLEFFGNEGLPARATIGTSWLALNTRVEVSCIAMLP